MRHSIAPILILPLILVAGCQSGRQVSTQERVQTAQRQAAEAAAQPQSPVQAVVDDPALQHNYRLAAFAGFFETAVRTHHQVLGQMPADITAFIDSGYLWLLPDPPRPAAYTFIENIGNESSPFWQQISFTFQEEIAVLGFFNLPEGQPLENPAGLAPMVGVQVTPGLTPRQAEYEKAHPLPADWERYVADPTTKPAERMDALRRRSRDRVERLAIHLFDTLDILIDRFTNTTGSLPANFDDLVHGNWVTTGPFQALQAAATTLDDPAARLTLYFEPQAKAFVLELLLFTRPGLEIVERRALAVDTEAEGPRRSALLLIVDPALVKLEQATTLTALAFPRTATGLPGTGAPTIEDQAGSAASAGNETAPAEAGAVAD